MRRHPPERPALLDTYKYSFILTACLWNTIATLRLLEWDRNTLQTLHAGGFAILTTATIVGSRKVKVWQEELYQFIRNLTSPHELTLVESHYGTQSRAQQQLSAAEMLARTSLMAHLLLSIADRTMSEESYKFEKAISFSAISLAATAAFILFYIVTDRADNLLTKAYSFSLRGAEREEEDLRALLAIEDNRVVPEAPAEDHPGLVRRLGS